MTADKKTAMEEAALPIALKNIKKVYDAGIPVAVGTDSGATPIRSYGFSEHMELQLLVRAGLMPLAAITVGTKNGPRSKFYRARQRSLGRHSQHRDHPCRVEGGEAGERRAAGRDSTARGLRRIHRSMRPGRLVRLRRESRSVRSEMAMRSAEVSINSSGSGSFRSSSSGRGSSGPDSCGRRRAISRVSVLRSGCLRISRTSWRTLRRAGEGEKTMGHLVFAFCSPRIARRFPFRK
jgi:hypothetical protein